MAKLLPSSGAIDAPALVVLGSSTLSGVTSVAIPVHLDATGFSKLAIAMFFVLGAGFAALYNLVLFPRVRRAGYPGWAIRIATLLVPVGVTGIWLSRSSFLYTLAGFALMLATTMVIPTVIGRVSTTARVEQDSVVFTIRQVMILGYVLGLGVYALAGAVDLSPLGFAVIIAIVTWLLTMRRTFSRRVYPAPDQDVPARATNVARHSHLVPLTIALALVTIMKSIDTLRGVYLPVIATHAGMGSGAISAMFAVTAVFELGVLAWLARVNRASGPMRTLIIVSAASILAFGLMLASDNILALLAAQAVYSVFGAGFQGVGMVLLSRATGRDAGRGAALFMLVMQTGTVLGAMLPLLVPGYSDSIFEVAILLSVICFILAAVGSSRSERWSIFS